MPERMTPASARYFAADWEATSFLEFFVDLQLRVGEDQRDAAGRTLARLTDHARFALQMTLVRAIDSFVAYLAEIANQISNTRSYPVLARLIASPGWGSNEQRLPARLGADVASHVPIELGAKYAAILVHGNVLQLAQEFESETDIPLFLSDDEIERVSRLSTLRNLISHGRTFASEELGAIVAETISVAGLGITLRSCRDDLEGLRVIVVRIDSCAMTKWGIEAPFTSSQLFEAISVASRRTPASPAGSPSSAHEPDDGALWPHSR